MNRGSAQRGSQHHRHHGHHPQQQQQQQQRDPRNLTMRNRSSKLEPLGRASLRSKGSSAGANSTASNEKGGSSDRVRALKSCCRKLVEFTFTQVIGELMCVHFSMTFQLSMA